MATQLLGQNTGCTSVPLSGINVLNFLSGSVTPQNFFFYSNNPETITNQIADSGIYLNKETLHGGPGQVFYWHSNSTGGPINSAIYLGNPNASPVNVTVSSRGIVPLQAPSDVAGWFQYYTAGQGQIVPVPARGHTLLYPQLVPKGAIFGGVLNMTIASPGSTVPLDVYDIAYKSATNISLRTLAGRDLSSRRRGMGNGYKATVNLSLDLLNVVQAGPFGFTTASQDDSIGSPSGADLVIVTDPDNSTASLGGNYGVQYFIHWTVSNSDTSSHTFKLYGGNLNTGGSSGTNFIINYTGPGGIGLGGCRNPNPLLVPGNYLPFLQDTMAPNGTMTYSFTLGTVGAFSYPLALVLALVS